MYLWWTIFLPNLSTCMHTVACRPLTHMSAYISMHTRKAEKSDFADQTPNHSTSLCDMSVCTFLRHKYWAKEPALPALSQLQSWHICCLPDGRWSLLAKQNPQRTSRASRCWWQWTSHSGRADNQKDNWPRQQCLSAVLISKWSSHKVVDQCA